MLFRAVSEVRNDLGDAIKGGDNAKLGQRVGVEEDSNMGLREVIYGRVSTLSRRQRRAQREGLKSSRAMASEASRRRTSARISGWRGMAAASWDRLAWRGW